MDKETEELDKLLSETGIKKSFVKRILDRLHFAEKVLIGGTVLQISSWLLLKLTCDNSMYSNMVGFALLSIYTLVAFRIFVLRMTLNQAVTPFFEPFVSPTLKNIAKLLMFIFLLTGLLCLGYAIDGIQELENTMDQLKKIDNPNKR